MTLPLHQSGCGKKRKIRLAPLAAAVAILTAGCSHTSDLGSGSLELTKLVSFESSEQITILPSGGASATKKASSGGFGDDTTLDITFSSDDYFSGVRFIPNTPWDWSKLSEYNLAVDLKNNGDESVQIYLSLTDERGKAVGDKVVGHRAASGNRAVNLAPGESGTYYLIIDGKFLQTDAGMREKPAPWQSDDEMFVWRYGQEDLNKANIAEMSLFVRGTLQDKSISVDNIRLRKNPDYDNSYLEGFVDQFGQNSRVDFPIKVDSEEELQQVAEAELAALAKSGLMKDRSRFGGWKDGPKFEGTGYFRTKKIDDQWWMVDPEGYLFFSHGVANVRMANSTTVTGVDFKDPSIRTIDPNEVTPEDSIGIINVSDEVRKTRYVRSELRHNMFNWLPSYDDKLADHYSYRRKVHRGPVDSGETFSFYRANLERRYGEQEPESYLRQWEQTTLDRMNDWGFTSFGNWVDPAFYPNQQVPYFANGWIIGDFKTLAAENSHWAEMPDPFDPEFVRRAKITIDVIAEEIKGSPWCVGVFVDNEKSWGFRTGSLEQRYGVILSALSKDANESPAKAAFSQHLQDKYGSISELNDAWGSAFASWSELQAGITQEYSAEPYVADLSTLLEMLSEEYFRVVHNTLETALPNHLYMGARMANFGMPDETIKASVKYSDVLSFNIYEEGVQENEWSFLNDIDLPSVIGEFHIGSYSENGLYHPGLVQAHDQKDRAQMYYNYMQSVANHKNMVGAHWFQYLDSPITGRAFDGEPYNVGFVSITDIPYPEMVAAAKKFNSGLYPNRYKMRKTKEQ